MSGSHMTPDEFRRYGHEPVEWVRDSGHSASGEVIVYVIATTIEDERFIRPAVDVERLWSIVHAAR